MKQKNLIRVLVMIALSASMTACVSTKTVVKTQVDDSSLGCDSLAIRIGEIQSARDYAKANRGASGSNVMAALFFWPALLVNNSNTSDMIKSMDEREATLNGLYKVANCQDEIPHWDTAQMKKKLKAGDTQESFN